MCFGGVDYTHIDLRCGTCPHFNRDIKYKGTSIEKDTITVFPAYHCDYWNHPVEEFKEECQMHPNANWEDKLIKNRKQGTIKVI